MDALSLLLSSLSGIILMPIAQFIKGKLPPTLNLEPRAIVAIFAFIIAIVLAYLVKLAPNATLVQLINMSFGITATAVLTHAATPSKLKNIISGKKG